MLIYFYLVFVDFVEQKNVLKTFFIFNEKEQLDLFLIALFLIMIKLIDKEVIYKVRI